MKWKSVARLQKQIMTYEKQIQQLKEDSNPTTMIELGGKFREGFPRQPEKLKCLGHSDRITTLVLHPI